ncbi:zeta toxin family protein [Aliarcobacter butzleri]|uniref:zeta toxin family protein n=1 Tax=Aliarcobacter butzleri TaxID=28197 RepID=UPI003AF48876
MDKKNAFIIAGPNGSGKTTFSVSLIKNTNILTGTHLNADIILKAYANDEDFKTLDPMKKHLKISALVEDTIDNLIKEGENLILETVFSSKYKLATFNKLKEAGYKINMVFVATKDPLINVNNVAVRYLKGGHEVAISKIFSRYAGALENLKIIAPITDCLIMIDNSVIDQTPIIYAATSNGNKCFVNERQGEIPNWINEILELLEYEEPDAEKLQICNQIQSVLDEKFIDLVQLDTDEMLELLKVE